MAAVQNGSFAAQRQFSMAAVQNGSWCCVLKDSSAGEATSVSR